MARIDETSTQDHVYCTIGELVTYGWPDPEEWGLLGSTDWSRDERVRFAREKGDDIWQLERETDDAQWYTALDKPFDDEDIPADLD